MSLPAFDLPDPERAPGTAEDSAAAALRASPALEEQAVCPFALIQAAIEQGVLTDASAPRVDPANLVAVPGASSGGPPPQPESKGSGKSLLTKASSFEKKEPSAIEKLRLTCPVSGVAIPLSSEAKDDDAASHKSGRSARSGSRKSGSRKSGSRKSGSRGKSKASSSNASSRRRGRKIPTFSEWEADNYIPQIKMAWDTITKQATKEEVSVLFTDKLLELCPELNAMASNYGKDKFASHMWKGLKFLSTSVDEPAALPNLLREIVPVHLEIHVKKEHVAHFGTALFWMLERYMGKAFDTTAKTAWEWLWTWLSTTFTMIMDEADEEATLVSTSWDIAMENYPQERFGELLFDILFSLAPNLKQTFAKPRQVLAMKFVEMIATLVTFNGDKATMEEQIVWLGVLHVQYGARPQHAQVFGQVLMNSLERAVGDEWTAEMHKAWMELWTEVSSIMLKITMDAEQYGEMVRNMWKLTQERTTTKKFGALLRANLLAGTEWVQTLSVGIQEKLDEALMSKEGRELALSKIKKQAEDRRQSLVDKLAADEPEKEEAAAGEGAEGSFKKSGSFKKPQQTVEETLKIKNEAKLKKEDKRQSESGVSVNSQGLDKDESGADANAIGKKFWEMITELLEVVWEPERMNERIIVMTTRLYALAIRPENIPTIGRAMGATIRSVLDMDWKEENAAAWNWFWGMASRSMEHVLSCLSRDEATLCRTKWELAKGTKSSDEIGEMIFQELARLAPHITHLFKKPKSIQALQFVSAIDIIVGFNEDPVNFFEELRPLAIRHIRYGVKADFARAFGKAILRTLSAVLVEQYDKETQSAFETLWLRVSCCVTRALAAGSNLVAVALINEDLETMLSAMDVAPRGERFDYLTQLNLNGEKFSPLYWAISEGQPSIAKFIISDLLCLRADRHSYYYGRLTLWQRHPDLMMVLCKDMPIVLPDLFDGLLWHARIVTNGFVRVNYYLREMYGDPGEVEDPWKTPMGVMVLYGKPENFVHPVVEQLLSLKYERFGKQLFIAMQAWFIAILVLYSVAVVAQGEVCDDTMVYMRYATMGLALATFAVQTVYVIAQYWGGKYIAINALGVTIGVPRYLANFWNAARYTSMAMTFASTIQEPCGNPDINIESRRVLSSFCAFLMWVQLMQLSVLFKKMAAFVYTLACMVPEICRNLLVSTVLLLCFVAAFVSLRLAQGEYKEPAGATVSLLQVVLAVSSEDNYLLQGWGLFFVIFLIIVINICMFNILVAQLTLLYKNLVVFEESFSMMNRAYICVEMESLLPMKYRKKFYAELGFDNPLEFDRGDEGPSGGIQVEKPSSIRVDPQYIPDRILRFTGESSPMDPWPSERNQADPEDTSEDIVDVKQENDAV